MAGAAVTRTQQLDNINVLASAVSVRKYLLSYTASATTTRPMLTAVQECGGSAGTDCLRPTTVSYQAGSPGWSTTATTTTLTGQYGFLAIDLNGDGILDALYGKLSGSVIHWYARIATTSGYGAELDTGATTADGTLIIPGAFTGHGQTEFLAAANGNVGTPWVLYSYNGTGFTATSTGLGYSYQQFAIDYDGNGLPDLVEASNGSINIRQNTTCQRSDQLCRYTVQHIKFIHDLFAGLTERHGL